MSRPQMMVVALTGGIGSGKSTVADHFATLGAPIIDTDLIARELVEPGSETLLRLSEAFGNGILDARGGLDRTRLRDIVFTDAAARRRLEAIMHPRIREIAQQRLLELHTPYAILVIPLLIETAQTDLADRVLVVDLSESLQMQRVRQRDGLSVAQIKRIMASQCSRAARLAWADDLIVNDGEVEALRAEVESLHRKYLELSGMDDTK